MTEELKYKVIVHFKEPVLRNPRYIMDTGLGMQEAMEMADKILATTHFQWAFGEYGPIVMIPVSNVRCVEVKHER